MKLFCHSFFNLLHIVLFVLHQVLLRTHESDSLFKLLENQRLLFSLLFLIS